MKTAPRIAANDNSAHRFYIYAWRYPDARTFYVGKGYGRRDREQITGRNLIFKRIVAKIRCDGGDPIVVRWHDGLRNKDALRLEATYIKLFGRRDNGTGVLANLTDGGEGEPGKIISSKQRARLRAANIGKTVSTETRAKISESTRGEKHHFFGKTHSEEARAKISEAQRGRPSKKRGVPLSAEQRAKLSAAFSGGKHPHIGKLRPPETGDKISLAKRMGGPRSGEYKGVSSMLNNGRWRAYITDKGLRRHLGYFATAKAAAMAYDEAAIETWGVGNCYLNSPEDVSA